MHIFGLWEETNNLERCMDVLFAGTLTQMGLLVILNCLFV